MTKRNLLGAAIAIGWALIVFFWSSNPNPEFGLGLLVTMLSMIMIVFSSFYIIYFYGKKISGWWNKLPTR